jgi:hypothetical protein
MFMTNSMFDSMPCTFDDHDRLEFLKNDKDAMLCFGPVWHSSASLVELFFRKQFHE